MLSHPAVGGNLAYRSAVHWPAPAAVSEKVSVAVKVSPILFAKVSISSILSAESIGIDISDNICKYH